MVANSRPWFLFVAIVSLMLGSHRSLGARAIAAEPTSASEVVGAAEPSTPAGEYGKGVRSTPWLTPEQERAGFHLPPGFEVRLFASDPQIAKPLNMAFDARGRLWLTQSVAYPYAADGGASERDAVMVLSDTDGDGTADQIVTFAEGLNIPIGILPYGEGCLCFSIPNLLYLRDTDGDGKCDRRDVVLGPFDTSRDTHGMINALRDGGDGWIYACHGFNNRSVIRGRDGHDVRMNSGNTFRFRPDGSRVEAYTFGQVNPFGMCEDQWGYRYSADCHSKPITQLIRGACYPSFGAPHDGLGFLPPMVDHLHGSTAICGILSIPPESPIKPLRNQMISGNVMTSRLNRNVVTYRGATAKGTEVSDFLTSNDPWFRPVDLQLGPDGHIYVADFYNVIIGHYEVPLDHPDRDRASGRIWQIRYVGSDEESKAQPELAGVDALRSENSTQRRLAVVSGEPAVSAARTIWQNQSEPAYRRVAAMRATRSALAREKDMLTLLCLDEDPRVSVEGFRLAAELAGRSPEIHDHAVNALYSQNAHVAQAAAEFLGQFGKESDIDPLFLVLSECDPADHVLRQTIRIAIRNLYRNADSDAVAWKRQPNAAFASVMLGIKRPEMIAGMLAYLKQHPDAENRAELFKHAARHATEDSLALCIDIAKQISPESEESFELLASISDSLGARPGKVAAPLRQWAASLVDQELQNFEQRSKQQPSLAWAASDGPPWPLRSRQLRNGKSAMLVDSIQRGEQYTGRLRSDPFPAPAEIKFWLAGHNGVPSEVDHGKNRVQLVDNATGEVLFQTRPPRNDVAKRVQWDTREHRDRMVRVECIDGDSAGAFAWLAIGEFEPRWILDLQQGKSLRRAVNWIKRLGLSEFEPRLQTQMNESDISQSLRLEVAGAVASLRQQPEAEVLLRFALRAGVGGSQLDQLVASTLQIEDPKVDTGPDEPVRALTKGLTAQQQREFALAWLQAGGAPSRLVKMGADGWVSTAALADADVRQSLAAGLSPEERSRFNDLVSEVDVDAAKTELLTRLQKTLISEAGDLENGKRVFKKHCAACHQLRGEGTVVGPQLDGAVTRSAARLLEDVITPDQNVDKAFRTTSFLLDEGRVQVGLVRSESDREIRLVDSLGKEVLIDPDTVEQRKDAGRSLMPGNFGEVLSATEIRDLVGYVRNQ